MNRRNLFAAGGAAALLLNSCSPLDATPAPIPPEGAGMLSAAAFGATGDGATDDTEALQRAFDAALNAPHPTFLHIPPGRYIVSRTLHIQYDTHTTGNVVHPHGIRAHGASLISRISDGSDVVRFTSGSVARFLLIEGLSVRGSRNDRHGIVLDCNRESAYLYNFCLRDVIVENCGGDGLHMTGNIFEGQVFNGYFRDNGGHGAYMGHGKNGGVLSAIHVFGSIFGGNGAHGAVLANHSNDVGFHGCYFLENARFGLSAENGCGLLSHCGFENNQMSAGSRAAGGAGVNISNFGTLIGCTSHSNRFQTHLARSFVVGNLTMIGCRASGTALAMLESDGRGLTTLIGCDGRVDRKGRFRHITAGAPATFGESWDSDDLMRLGGYRLWIDGEGRLRIKNGTPTADNDGQPVGI